LSVGGTDIPFSLTANSTTNVTIPQSAYLGNIEGKITNKGIHITSLKPVVVYSHIYDASVSGATLVLPTNTLGKEYYSINYQQISNNDNSFSFFFVVGIILVPLSPFSTVTATSYTRSQIIVHRGMAQGTAQTYPWGRIIIL
jgi:hypothetical protein